MGSAESKLAAAQGRAAATLADLQDMIRGAAAEVAGVRPWLELLVEAADLAAAASALRRSSESQADASAAEERAAAAAREAEALEAALVADLQPLVEAADRHRRRMLGQVAALRAEEEILATRRRAIVRQLDLLDERMLEIVAGAGGAVEAPSVRVAVHRTPGPLVVESWVEPALLPRELVRVSIELDKPAIKRAIKAGAIRGFSVGPQGRRVDWK